MGPPFPTSFGPFDPIISVCGYCHILFCTEYRDLYEYCVFMVFGKNKDYASSFFSLSFLFLLSLLMLHKSESSQVRLLFDYFSLWYFIFIFCTILDIKIIVRINPTHRSPLPPNNCCGLLLLLCPRTSPTYRVRFINLLLSILFLLSSLRLSLFPADISLRLFAISGTHW